MPFTKNDPRTKELGRKGGKSGDKHFKTVPKETLKKITSKAGKLSGEARRKKREERKAQKFGEAIMEDYLE